MNSQLMFKILRQFILAGIAMIILSVIAGVFDWVGLKIFINIVAIIAACGGIAFAVTHWPKSPNDRGRET